MDILRQIGVFDNQTESLIRELSIDSFDLEIFKKRFEIRTPSFSRKLLGYKDEIFKVAILIKQIN